MNTPSSEMSVVESWDIEKQCKVVRDAFIAARTGCSVIECDLNISERNDVLVLLKAYEKELDEADRVGHQ